jgi:cytochrome c-type biogenesis protein
MYAAGLLTSFSPCVWGLLPLTMSYISTAAGEREDQQTTLPTLAFAAGLAVVFCTLGVTAVELGGVFGSSSSTNAILPIFSNGICMIMGLQLLGFVELPSLDVLSPKSSGQSRSSDEPILLDATGRIIDSKRKEAEEGSLFRTFLLGGSSALVSSPCATPVLTSILAFVAAAKNPALGAFLLLGYTLGYSTPLLLVASTGGKALVNLRQTNGKAGFYAQIAPWVTPLTAGVLLWYGTDGLLVSVFGDPSMAGLAIL